MKQQMSLTVNGEKYELAVEPRRLLVDVLREDLELTGTKKGCDLGVCGACTVIMDGKLVSACLTLALDAKDKEITTIEGLAEAGVLHPLQRSFVENWAIQCGFCTPGMIITAKVLLDENPSASEEEIRQALSGNLCRCTGYVKIINAVRAGASSLKG
jgi:carbon-monoxide dehydrogenase small subunit